MEIGGSDYPVQGPCLPIPLQGPEVPLHPYFANLPQLVVDEIYNNLILAHVQDPIKQQLHRELKDVRCLRVIFTPFLFDGVQLDGGIENIECGCVKKLLRFLRVAEAIWGL
jgi:hypothetical protein